MCDECHQSPCANTCPNAPEPPKHYKQCPVCLKEYDEEDMDYAVCDNCISKNATYENALAWGEKEKYEIEINGFLAYSFTVKEVEEILLRELNQDRNVFIKSARNSLAFDFCTDDQDAFADWLKERENK